MADIVARQHADAITLADAARDQQARRALRGGAELGPTPGFPAKNDERTSGVALRPAAKGPSERVVVRRVQIQDFERLQHGKISAADAKKLRAKSYYNAP
jgi:hypothetical protein